MKYLDEIGLATYDGKIKSYIDQRCAVIPLNLIENIMGYDAGRDLTDEYSYAELLEVCNCVVNCQAQLMTYKIDGHTFTGASLMAYSANNDISGTNISLWFSLIVDLSGVLNTVNVTLSGTNATERVVLAAKSVSPI